MRFQALLPFNRPIRRRSSRASLQHGDELRHQHQLAVVRAGNDHELPHPDGGAHGPQFRVGGDRHCARDRAGARLRAALGPQHRQFLGRSGALHALHPAAGFDCRRPVLRLAGHAAEPLGLHRCHDPRRRQAGHRSGPGCLAGGDQDVRHERRRLLQRQLRPSVREPQRHHKLRADGADLLDWRGADQRVRPHGRRSTPGLGGVRRHGAAVPGRRGHGLLGPKRRATPPSPSSASKAATWRARRSASASSIPPCSQR